MRPFAVLLNCVGFVGCVATGATGAYFGMGHSEIREIHLKIAIATICTSAIGHAFSLIALKKSSK